jgi:pyruvate/2-oxoglutarate dehydrogenase complex dihydrolipoamide acyltransferase (E2) component
MPTESVREISRDMGELSARHGRKSGPAEMQGASILWAVSGHGVHAMNWPEVAILGVHDPPSSRYGGKEFQPRLMLPLSPPMTIG